MNRRQLLAGSAATVAASAIPANPRMLEGPMVMLSTPAHATDLYAELLESVLRDITQSFGLSYEELTKGYP